MNPRTTALTRPSPVAASEGTFAECNLTTADKPEPEMSSNSPEALANQVRPSPDAPTAPSAPPDDPHYKWKVLFVSGSGIFMVTLDSGVVNVALPSLAREFDAALTITQWVSLGYVLSVAGFLLPAGKLADLRGRRDVFLFGFGAFGLASILCGLAPGVYWLILARVVQGIAGALIQANTGALVASSFPAKERGRALGLQGSVVSIGLLSGPVIGGFITEFIGWRWAFYVNVPISMVAISMGLRLLGKSPRQAGQPFDLAGAILLVTGAGATLLGVTQGSHWGWESPFTIGSIAVGIGATAALVVVERRVAFPLIDLVLFQSKGFVAALASAFLLFITLAPVGLLVPFYLALVLHLPASQIGARLIVLPATSAAIAPISGYLSDRIGVRTLAGIGATTTALGLLSLVFLPDAGTTTPLIISLLVIGIGQSLFLVPNNSAIYESALRERYGLVGGMVALNRNIAQSFGQATGGALWTVVVRANAPAGVSELEAPSAALMLGFQTVFAVSVVCAAVAFIVAVIVRPPRTLTIATAPSST